MQSEPSLLRRFKENLVTDVRKFSTFLTNKFTLSSTGLPFNTATGEKFSTANTMRLLFSGLKNGFSDNRWITKKQLEGIKHDKPLSIKDDAKPVEILKSISIPISVAGKPSKEMTLVYPVGVYNAEQIENFPKKQHQQELSNAEKINAVETLIAKTGIPVVHDVHTPSAFYSPKTDTVVMPKPTTYQNLEEYTAAKTTQAFIASSHESRQPDLPPASPQTNLGKAAVFSVAAAATTGLPVTDLSKVNQYFAKFSSGKTKQVFSHLLEVGRMVTVLNNALTREHVSQDETATYLPKWMPSAPEQERLLEEAKIKLQGMEFADGLPNAAFSASIERDMELRAEAYTAAYSKSLDNRKELIRVFEDSGLFGQEDVARFSQDEKNKPLQFSFNHNNEQFNVLINEDKEIIEKSNFTTAEEFKKLAAPLLETNFRTKEAAKSAFESVKRLKQ